ncbi:MAG: glycosyltransferase family 39 protein [Nanoarchaeota archaeon]
MRVDGRAHGGPGWRLWAELFVIVAVVATVTMVYNYTPGASTWDSAVYLGNAASFAGMQWLYDEIRPPLYPLLLSIPMRVFGMAELPLLIVDIAVRVLCVLALYFFIRRFSDARCALPVVLIVVLNPIVKDLPVFMTEYLSLLFILVACHALVRYVDARRPYLLWLASALMSLAFLARYTSLFIIVVAALFLAYHERRALLRGETLRAYCIGVLVFLAPIAVWCVWNYGVYDDFFFSIYRAYQHIQYDALRTSFATRMVILGRTVGLLLALALPGLWRVDEKGARIDRLFMIWLGVYVVSMVLVRHFTARYLFFLLPPLAYFAWRNASMAMRWAVAACVVVLFLLPLPREDNDVQGIVPPQGIEMLAGTIIVGDPSPQVALMARTKTYGLCEASCDYLRCPVCPWSFYASSGCETPTYFVTTHGRPFNVSMRSCLGEPQRIGELDIYPITTTS